MPLAARWFAALFAASMFGAAIAAADVPDPAHSSVDRVLLACPQGDVTFTVVARGFANTPKAGVSVSLDMRSCPAFAVCPDTPDHPTTYYVDVVNHAILGVTNGQGVVEFHLRMGAVCPDSLAIVYGDGVVFGQRSVVSPDQNGDLGVDGQDVALLLAKVGQADPTGDFDGDGVVTAADVTLMQAHLGHVCDVATGAKRSTWGRLKATYR
jgi:hypothetical protein